MKRTWIAVALLSLSWMLGLHYYTAANGWLWTTCVLAAVLLAAELPRRLPCRSTALAAALLVVPTLWLLPWPHAAIPLALAVGLTPLVVNGSPGWLTALGWGAVRSAMILSAQAVALRAYSFLTARCHDLPWPAPRLVATLARLLGADAAADGTTATIFSPAGPQRLAVTWELVFDPISVCLAIGAIGLTLLWAWEDRTAPRRLLGKIGLAAAVVAAWIPVRLALLMGLFLHRELRAPGELKLTVMNQFFSPTVLGAATFGAVLGLAWFVRREPAAETTAESPKPLAARSLAISVAVLVLLVTFASMLLFANPIGSPRGGRVLFVERHSDWEPTDRAYDIDSYGHDPSYSYTAVYRYCEQYYDVARLQDDEAIDTARLAECDVLVIKTPTEPYSQEEADAVLRFVARGGGLLLIGEHTDIDRMGTHLNRIVQPLGFKFRPDILFDVDDPYVQHVSPRSLPHPAVRNVPPMRYAGSCSIDPGWSLGRAAVWNTGLWGLDADYNMSNFFPQAQYLPEMRYGAFIQLWETRHGRGRVLAFTDSTIFSNFSTFEPGKAELMLDMLSWLNHRGMFDASFARALLCGAGLALLGLAVWLIVRRFPSADDAWLVWFGCGLLGLTTATSILAAWQRGHLPEPVRPMVRVVIDRETSRVPLSAGGFTKDPNGYGLLEQWIPRLGHRTLRAEGRRAFSGDVLLILSPTRSVSENYRRQLVDWVSEGGRLIVFDSPDSVGTTANSLLWPFDMAVYHSTAVQGLLRMDDQWPGLAVSAACPIEGGEPMMWVGETPVAARKPFGKGSVTAIGFGMLMNNQNMGHTWTTEPGDRELLVYSVLYELINSTIEDRPLRSPLAADPAESE